MKDVPLPADNMDVIHLVMWLMVLASRSYYSTLDRALDRAHLIRLLDIYIPYAERGALYHQPMFEPVPYERRVPLALRLRALLETWTPPELPEEITLAARELLHAEGLPGPHHDWETWISRMVDPDLLLWPEGIPWLLRHQQERQEALTTMAIGDEGCTSEPVKLVLGTEGHPGSLYSDFSDVMNTKFWLMVLAAPPLYRTMERVAVPDHLARLIDVFISYAERGTRYSKAEFEPVPREQRVPLARKLQALLLDWTPPDLPPEITEAARDLLHAEGLAPPDGGWDALQISGPDPVEDILLWPEGVPALLRDQKAHQPP
ncbi:MAG: hypothetical protein ACMG6S_04140 [Byssovorax sp.]